MWLTSTSSPRVLFFHDGSLRQGYLSHHEIGGWYFEERLPDGTVLRSVRVPNIATTWRDRVLEGSLVIGWQGMEYGELEPSIGLGTARHVSAKELKCPCPGFLSKALKDPGHPDYEIWKASYTEEYDGLRMMGTYKVITRDEIE